MYADAVLCAVLQAESMDTPSYVPTSASSMKVDKMHFKVILIFIPWKSKCDLNRLNRQIPSLSKFLVSFISSDNSILKNTFYLVGMFD